MMEIYEKWWNIINSMENYRTSVEIYGNLCFVLSKFNLFVCLITQ